MVRSGSSAVRADVYELLNCFKGVLLLMLRVVGALVTGMGMGS